MKETAEIAPTDTSEGRSTLGAILLAGGRATRMDGVAKPLLEVGGRTMLQHAIDACLAVGCAPITVVGPPPEPASFPEAVGWAREEPPFSGPAAGVVAALATWEHAPEWTFLLACDLPRIGAAVRQLRDDMMLLPSDTDGMCLADGSSRPQWLTGVYRTGALVVSAAALADEGRNASMRTLLDDLAIAVVAASADVTGDVDTWEDLEKARARARGDQGGRA